MKKILLTLLLLSVPLTAFAKDDFVWKNDLRSKFLNNETVIMEINMRSFNSQDKDGDGFIQEDMGEVRGTFVNGIQRLDEIKNLGLNTLHILPITPTGKLKALGTAGSLYSASDFSSLNPDLYDKNSKLSFDDQAKNFINEAHKRGIRVIVDVPACGSYDLFLQRPDLFVTTPTGEPVLPSDWTDVRLLATGTEDKIDPNVFSLYKDFVKYMMNLGVDGIRADVAHCKTASFWKALIDYSREKDPEFMWLAESSESWHDAVSPYGVFTSYDKLLEAGFDGYYGSFFNIKDCDNAQKFYSEILKTLNNLKKLPDKKSVIGSFTTHDEVSPILLKGQAFSDMIIWLNATLPVNSYFVDGFQSGDDYKYLNANNTAPSSNTDDEIYFTHRGELDIFNLSRKPEGNNTYLKNDFIIGNSVKKSLVPVINKGNFTPLKTGNPKVFAYTIGNIDKKILVYGNLNFKDSEKVKIKIPDYNKKSTVVPLKVTTIPAINHGKINTVMSAGEIVVIVIKTPLK